MSANAMPEKVWDEAFFATDEKTPVVLNYVEGSAKYKTAKMGEIEVGERFLSEEGMLVGTERMDGIFASGIENAAVLDNDIKSLYTTSTTVFNEDEENDLTEKYSHTKNIVLVNEIPAIYVPTGATDETFKSIVKTIDKKLFSNRIQVKCHYNSHTGVRTIRGEVSAMKYVDLNTLGYFVGCYMEEDRNWYYNEESHVPFIYFTDTQVLENIGLVIAYQKIVTAASEDFPYGYVTGNIVLRCGTNNDGYYDPGTGIVRRDMIHKLGTMDIGFKN